MDPIVIQTNEAFEEVASKNNVYFLFKHSLTCPISAQAKSHFDEFCEKTNNIPCYILYVQEARTLSNYIADTYHVKHESPQILLFKDNKVIWHESHSNITSKVLIDQVNSKLNN